MADSLEDFDAAQIAQLAQTYKSLLDNPETRELALRMTKKVNPGVSIPEIDLKDAAAKAFKAQADRQDALEQQIRERDARDRINGERAALREQGFSASDVNAIEKIMTDEHIPSYATASKYYKAQQQVAQPTPHGAQSGGNARTFSLPQTAMDALKGGKNGLRQFGRESAAAALDEIRSGQIKLH
jgi:hypothetical protein